MTDTIPNKLYRYIQPSGEPVYEILPGTNTPSGYTEVSQAQALQEIANYQPTGSSSATSADLMRAYGDEIKNMPTDSGIVASWTAPWGETLTNVSQATIDDITKNYGTEGYMTPAQIKANNAELASQPQNPTGVQGNNTAQPIVKKLGDVSGGISPSATPQFPTISLQPGSTNTAAVKQLQDYLVSQGYMTQAQVNTGYGTYGPQTTAAVKALQQSLGVDNSSGPGYWGPKTLAAVQAQGGSTGTGGNGIETGGTGTGGTGSTGTGTGGTSTGTGTGGTGGGTSFSAVTGYQTGNAQLDAIVAGLQTTLNQMIASGQVINPNIALSPSDITTFLNQAKGIIDPYFSSQISQIQEGLNQNLTSLQQQWDNEQQADQLAFQQSLASSREANATAGETFSGGRNLQELQMTQSAQNTINQQQNSLQSQAQGYVNLAAQQIGSSSTNTLPFNTYTASNQGLGSVNQSGQLAYSPINVTQGSLEAAQQTAESTQATSLAAQALQSRALGFYPSTT